MKKTFGYIAYLLAAGTLIVMLFSCLSSCNKEPKPLAIYGEWHERRYDTIIYNYIVGYDTVINENNNDTSYNPIYYSHTRQKMFLECPVSENGLKKGDFRLHLISKHQPSLSCADTFTYMEFVRGTYYLNEDKSELKFEGKYYTDSLAGVLCNDSNTRFSFGDYNRYCIYNIDETELTLYFRDAISSDLNTFIQPEGGFRPTCY